MRRPKPVNKLLKRYSKPVRGEPREIFEDAAKKSMKETDMDGQDETIITEDDQEIPASLGSVEANA